MHKRTAVIIGIVLILLLMAVLVFFMQKKTMVEQVQIESGSTLPVSENDILIQDPLYYLSKIQPYFAELENAVNKNDMTAALSANEKIYGYLVKMEQVSIVPQAKEQIQFLMRASENEKNALNNKNQAAMKSALETLRLLKVMQFQARKGEIDGAGN